MNNVIDAAKIDVELLSPKPGDYLVFYVDTGKLTSTRASEHVIRVAKEFNTNSPPNDGVNRIFLSKSDSRGNRIELITPTPNPVIPNMNWYERGEYNGSN
jgi:hypothetical protein